MKTSITITIGLLCILPAMAAPLYPRDSVGAVADAMNRATAELEASRIQTQRLQAQIDAQRKTISETHRGADVAVNDVLTREAEPFVIFPNQNIQDHGLVKPFEWHQPFVSKIPVHDRD